MSNLLKFTRLKIGRYLLPVALGLLVGLAALWLNILSPVRTGQPASITSNNSTSNNQGQVGVPIATAMPSAPLSAAASLGPQARPAAPSGLGSEYLALGDSVAFGLGVPVPLDQGYAGLFYSNYLKIAQPGFLSYRNLAVPGETSDTFITNSKGKSQLQRAFDELDNAAKNGRHVSPITLTIGGNDMLDARGKSNSEREATLTQFEANFSRILNELKARAGQADIIVTGYYNPYSLNSSGSDIENSWVQRFNATILKQAHERGLLVADFYSPVNGAGLTRALTWSGSGDVHPTTLGHAVLAQAVWKAGGYDKQAPRLALSYSSLTAESRRPGNQRLAFKLQVVDDWSLSYSQVVSENETFGAGSLASVSVLLNNENRQTLSSVPVRFSKASAGVQEYSYLLDTANLPTGHYTLRFEASDVAGNTGSHEINFDLP